MPYSPARLLAAAGAVSHGLCLERMHLELEGPNASEGGVILVIEVRSDLGEVHVLANLLEGRHARLEPLHLVRDVLEVLLAPASPAVEAALRGLLDIDHVPLVHDWWWVHVRNGLHTARGAVGTRERQAIPAQSTRCRRRRSSRARRAARELSVGGDRCSEVPRADSRRAAQEQAKPGLVI